MSKPTKAERDAALLAVVSAVETMREDLTRLEIALRAKWSSLPQLIDPTTRKHLGLRIKAILAAFEFNRAHLPPLSAQDVFGKYAPAYQTGRPKRVRVKNKPK